MRLHSVALGANGAVEAPNGRLGLRMILDLLELGVDCLLDVDSSAYMSPT